MVRSRSSPWLAALGLAAISAGGCGGGEAGDVDAGGDGSLLADGPPSFEAITPAVAYSGFDGMHAYRVPFGTTLDGEVVWAVDDPTIAAVASAVPPDGLAEGLASWAMVTTMAVGTTRVTARVGDLEVAATLEVVAYDPADYDVGETRYTDPADPADDRPACASCHLAEGGADHSPLAIAIYDDAAVVQGIRTGTYPDGYFFDDVVHEWNLTEPEAAGIIPYLRALPPRGF